MVPERDRRTRPARRRSWRQHWPGADARRDPSTPRPDDDRAAATEAAAPPGPPLRGRLVPGQGRRRRRVPPWTASGRCPACASGGSGGRGRQPLPSLPDRYPEVAPGRRVDVGMRTIDVADIRGTAVGGGDQRGGDFLPLQAVPGPELGGALAAPPSGARTGWSTCRRSTSSSTPTATGSSTVTTGSRWPCTPARSGHRRLRSSSWSRPAAAGREPIGSLAAEVEAARPMRDRRSRPTRPRRGRTGIASMIRRLTIDVAGRAAVRRPWRRAHPLAGRVRRARPGARARGQPGRPRRPSTRSSGRRPGARLPGLPGRCIRRARSTTCAATTTAVAAGPDRRPRCAERSSPTGRWHAIDGLSVAALEWPGVRHGDRRRHDGTAWADVLRVAALALVAAAGRPRRAAHRAQPRAAARESATAPRIRTTSASPAIAGCSTARIRRCGCTATCRRRASRAGEVRARRRRPSST